MEPEGEDEDLPPTLPELGVFGDRDAQVGRHGQG